MDILVTGSSGLVGSALISYLTAKGDNIRRMVRDPKRAGPTDVLWDPARGTIDTPALEGVNAVVHLAGEGIAGARWTAAKKKRIRDSRVQGTSLLADALTRLSKRPQVLVSASAIGYYGDRGNELLTEESKPGAGFLAGVCREWEEAAQRAAPGGIRVVNLRIGLVLSSAGGALKAMLPAFRIGFGGIIGGGDQYWSWIALDDLVGVFRHCLETESLQGPVNGVSPHPVTNKEFTRAMGTVLSRPTLFPLPSFAARLLLGEMADELLLSSSRVQPVKLQASSYSFMHEELHDGLRTALLAESR